MRWLRRRHINWLAAHTITLIARDLELLRNEGADDAYDEDITQLREEVERCRKILAELNEDATSLGQQMNEPQPPTAFVTSLIDERFADIRDMLQIEIDKKATGAMPQISRHWN